MKDAKHIFVCAKAKSEPMIVDRILVRILPVLVQHGQMLTTDAIEQADHIPVPDALYDHIRDVAEELVGCNCTDA